MIRSGNPVLKDSTFVNAPALSSDETMTIQGTVNKTGILLLLVIAAASLVWKNPVGFMPFLMPALVGALIAAIVTAVKKQWVAITAPIYAVLEGLVLGALSAIFEKQFPGIVMQAVGLTFGTLGALLLAYKSRLIQATENFKLGVTAATGGIALFYLISMVLSWFGVQMTVLTDTGFWGIAVSLFVVTIAALNLVMDFDFIERAASYGAPKYMEWYGAFGLMVTLIWLYMEILRLLAKLQSSRR